MTNLVDRLEDAIRESGVPRPLMFRDLDLLVNHNWVPYREGEETPRCLWSGDRFPCLTIQRLAADYGLVVDEA
ncbi:hypothetical protein ACWGIU_21995 [Streptomyces sp. NPDC054840]